MKKLAYIILSVVVGSVLASSSVMAEPKKSEKAEKTDATQTAVADTKITKDGAQKAVLQKYPGATINSCAMETVKGNSVWVVRFIRTGANTADKVMVDPATGKVSRL